jgi:hypothetical protein
MAREKRAAPGARTRKLQRPAKKRKEKKRKDTEDGGILNTGKKKWYQTFVSLVEKENDVRAALQ